MRKSFRWPSHATIVAYLALFVALGTGGAWAASTIGGKDIKDSAIRSRHIRDGQVKTADLRDNAVNSQKVDNDSLTGDDINESTLSGVNADQFGGKLPSSYLTSLVYTRDSPLAAGTPNVGATTFQQSVSCDAGDVAIGGGVSRVDTDSVLIEFGTFLSGASARINPDTDGDTFEVSVTCLDQTT